ncbi:CaiB/BaiF CoA transferase family protein [Achromobacter xylosoxidans]|uniref:CaiB/BaiF CoA transferase family protein n=1 Tax=Alcaligenes xylosoxydans xylosoxydans TaxID=85698 RepID=UPI000665104C|nr:CoA transferase [Achromobacter xylosoxidans]
MEKVLAGVKVLDFGRFIAGPFCAALLADFGADVIRVDRLGGSEDRYVMPVTDEGEGAFFLQVNRNKRSMTLNLEAQESRDVLHRLLCDTDVVVANMPPRTIASLGLDYESLRAVKPDIILTASSAFGSHPSVRDRVGFDGVGQAMSGAVHMAGFPEHPIKAMVPVVDFATAMSCAFGTVMALYERGRSGRGQEVDASLLRTALNFSSGSLIEESLLKLGRQATVNRSPNYGPSDIYQVQDGWIIVQVVGAPMFKRWVRLMDKPELLDDPRFADDARRGEHGETLSAMMKAWCIGRTRQDALATLERARIPAGPVYSPRQALDDETVRDSGAFAWTGYPGLDEEVPLITAPVSLSRTPPAIERRPPRAGEHTDEVLAQAGYSPGEIARLREQGVI